ncbi:MAG: GFA family protein [Burkholderiaceae bacterium]
MAEMTSDRSAPDLIGDMLDLELDAELRAQVVVDTAIRYNLDPLTLAQWIFRPVPPERRLAVAGINRPSMYDCIDLHAPQNQIPPELGESAWSFAARVAEANGYVGAKALRRFVSVYLGWLGDPAYTHAFRWYWLAPRFHEEICAWLAGREAVRWARDPLRPVRPFCQECLRQGSVFLEAWEQTDDHCFLHSLALQHHCHHCGAELTWRTGTFGSCPCGAVLAGGRAARPKRRSASDQDKVANAQLCERPFAASLGERLLRQGRSRKWGPKSCHFGGCACGGVIVEVLSKPLFMGLCHCSVCRQTGAHPRAFCVLLKEQVGIHGETVRWTHGATGARLGCSRCGAPIVSSKFDSLTVELHATVLDDPQLFRPQFEQWVSKRLSWVGALDVPQFAEDRPDQWWPPSRPPKRRTHK